MLLEAFWLYCNSYENKENMDECNKIMGKKIVKNK